MKVLINNMHLPDQRHPWTLIETVEGHEEGWVVISEADPQRFPHLTWVPVSLRGYVQLAEVPDDTPHEGRKLRGRMARVPENGSFFMSEDHPMEAVA